MNIETSLYEEVSNITDIDYEGLENPDTFKTLVTNESIVNMLNDLIWSYGKLKNEYEEFKEDVKENYERKPYDYYY